MIEIREIKPNEHEFLREMLYEALYFADEGERLPRSIVNEPHLSKYVDGFGRRGDLAFVPVDKNELVGAAWSRLFSENEKGYGFVDAQIPELSMAIMKPYRNRSFGYLLMQTLFRALSAEGFEKLSLSVDQQSPAVGLYRRTGFEIVSEEKTAFTMLKNL